ncbi:hypothetical protein GCM10009867_24320 [Pedococcus aerophilus]|uniref:Uncharacterized protein n=1 Tax=Pedococcus aerophilus TaxID=436356 RepID=A0ABN3URF3_9MICO
MRKATGRYAARGLARSLTGALVLLGVMVMHGFGIGHGGLLPGHQPGHGPAPVQHAPTQVQAPHADQSGHPMMSMAPQVVILVATVAAVTPTDDLTGHGGEICTAVLRLLLGLLTLLAALALLGRPGHAAPVQTVRRRRVRGSPPTRHTTSLLLLCVSRT